jgi:hypothetical protein
MQFLILAEIDSWTGLLGQLWLGRAWVSHRLYLFCIFEHLAVFLVKFIFFNRVKLVIGFFTCSFWLIW